MPATTIEISGEPASNLNAMAKEREVTLNEFVIQVLLEFLEEYEDPEEGELDDEDDEEAEDSQ